MQKLLPYIPILVLILTVVSVVLLQYYASPEALIAYVGISNGYLLMMALAFLSGLSLFTGAPYTLIVVTLVAGGLNPLLLAFVATIGDTLGSTVAYGLGRTGGELTKNGLFRPAQESVLSFARSHPRLVPGIIFIYGCIAPFSNDVVTIPLGILRYPYARVMIPLQLGTFIYNAMLAFIGLQVYTYFFG